MIQNDKAFFEKLIKEYSPMLYAQIRSVVLHHEDTDDVLQETFLKVWKSLPNFRMEADIKTWLFRIAHNESLQHLRRKEIRKKLNRFAIGKHSVSLQHGTEATTAETKLENALKTLTKQQRSVFGMRYLNETPFKEIAKVLNLAEGTVKAVYHQANKKVISHLLDHAEE